MKATSKRTEECREMSKYALEHKQSETITVRFSREDVKELILLAANTAMEEQGLGGKRGSIRVVFDYDTNTQVKGATVEFLVDPQEESAE